MSAVLDAGRISFRPMEPADLDTVLAIESRAYTHPWTPGIFRDCLRAGYSAWLMEDTDGVCGYGVMSLAVGECHILNICVAPENQGRGLGRGLLEHLLWLAAGHGAEIALLEVRPSNLPALHLYEAFGFSEVGVRKAYYPAASGREDGLILALPLLRRE